MANHLRVMRILVPAAIAAGLLGLPCRASAEFACPQQLRPAVAAIGFEAIGTPPEASQPLAGGRLFDGPPGEERRDAPAELAPDEVTTKGSESRSLWDVSSYPEGLLLVCRYANTTTYLRGRIPAGHARCVLSHRGKMVSMACR